MLWSLKDEREEEESRIKREGWGLKPLKVLSQKQEEDTRQFRLKYIGLSKLIFRHVH